MEKNTNYWVVGSFHGGEDITNRFLKESIWFDGYGENNDYRYLETLKLINIGDILVMKSSATKGKGNSITFTKVKGIGQVLYKIADHKFEMKWFKNEAFPLDFNHVSYRKTIESLREDSISFYVNNLMNEIENESIIKVLEYKKQIILQGPPGTGKTYTAEAIAKQFTEVETVSNPSELLDEFYKNFNAQDSEIIKSREERQDLRERFLASFSKESLKTLTLENYCIGTGGRDNFCWWIERGLKRLGYYFPGSSLSYRLYWSKSKDEYVKSGFAKDITEDNKAMKLVATALYNLVQSKIIMKRISTLERVLS